MQQSSLRPAGEFASQYGFKSIIYGPPGSGKTPVINTAPRPVMLVTEPGMLSMRGSKVPAWQGFTAEAIDEFFKWLFHSNETKNFDTVAIDSVSQMADVYLQAALGKKTSGGNQAHGLKAYGEMATNTMSHLRSLYFLQHKHTYLVCKQFEGVDSNNILMRKPFFPGQQLPVDVPHMYDAILHFGIHSVPGVGQVRSFQCSQSIDTVARDRSGKLAEYEQPDFGLLVRKAMG